jgi:hypothetical protein
MVVDVLVRVQQVMVERRGDQGTAGVRDDVDGMLWRVPRAWNGSRGRRCKEVE